MGTNTRYLKDLISEVGWIDVQRFGYPASNAAFLLVQHSYDLPLMMAVLPRIKADVDADRTEGEPYALLVDRLQLALGEKQLYGSQVFTNEYGEYAILPVAEPDRLGERRAALHMTSIAEYMQAWGSTEVRISSACSSERPPKAAPYGLWNSPGWSSIGSGGSPAISAASAMPGMSAASASAASSACGSTEVRSPPSGSAGT